MRSSNTIARTERKPFDLPRYDEIALVLQGGGALVASRASRSVPRMCAQARCATSIFPMPLQRAKYVSPRLTMLP